MKREDNCLSNEVVTELLRLELKPENEEFRYLTLHLSKTYGLWSDQPYFLAINLSEEDKYLSEDKYQLMKIDLSILNAKSLHNENLEINQIINVANNIMVQRIPKDLFQHYINNIIPKFNLNGYNLVGHHISSEYLDIFEGKIIDFSYKKINMIEPEKITNLEEIIYFCQEHNIQLINNKNLKK